MRLLALSGSLRAASTNTALLRAASRCAPAGVELVLYEELARLPAFNPDRDGDGVDGAVLAWRRSLERAAGVVIASPEYAHGVPGALKNALDWVVGSPEMVEKPVALFSATPRGDYAQAALAEILRTMSASIVADAAITVPLLGKSPTEVAAVLAGEETQATLASALRLFVRAIGERERRE